MGGNAIEGVGKIHRSEIEPTLKEISKITGQTLDYLKRNLLGSCGKKEFSGDIDIAMEYQDERHMSQTYEDGLLLFGEANVFRHGRNIHIKFPIQDYQHDSEDPEPRTGFVQVDFLFGDIELMKVYSYAPSEDESDYTGTHRNLGIISICRWLDREESKEVDDFGRPVELTRWKWSPKVGLQKVIRTSTRNKVDPTRWVSKQTDTPVSMPFRNKQDIIDVLFKGVGEADQLDSLEKICLGVRKCYSAAEQKNIFRTMAEEFMGHRRLSEYRWSYPPEIDKHYSFPTK